MPNQRQNISVASPHWQRAIVFLGTTAIATALLAQTVPSELGNVRWLRDLDTACRQSQQTGRPILLLFQEIPGCETCQDFGATPLSHPLMVEAIEDLFVPLAIHNNKPGMDEKVLKQFDEPAWNNPVIRYINAAKEDIIPRQDRIWSIGATAQRMVEALEQAQCKVPAYLKLVAEENSGDRQTAIFCMHCYWEGESQLGQLSGVVETQSAWLRGQEIVEVTFDPATINFGDLLQSAKAVKCADCVFASTPAQSDAASEHGFQVETLGQDERTRPAKDSDQKYYLRKTALKHLPLTPLQSARINAALRHDQDPTRFLSPRQRQLLQRILVIVAETPQSLSQFIYPPTVDQLPAYDQRLRAAVDISTNQKALPTHTSD